MEDLKREFEQGPGDMPRDQDLQVRRTPENGPIPTQAGTIQTEELRQQYLQGSKGIDRRHTDDGAESAIRGVNKLPRHRERAPRDNDVDSARSTNPTPYVPATIGSVCQPSQSVLSPPRAHSVRDGSSPGQSRDDLDVLRGSNALSQDQELRLWRENAELRRELELEKKRREEQSARADQEQSVAATLQEQLDVQEARLNSSLVEIAEGNDVLAGVVGNLKKENAELKAELEDARSHIFSLQPYRKDLTPEEAGRDFDDLIDMISDWVLKFAEPIIDNPAMCEKFVSAAKKHPNDISKLRKFILSHGDLVHGCFFPDTDIDILTAIVLRFVYDNIFQKVLFGELRNSGEVVTSIEAAMQTSVEPKRDQFSIRTWRAEAFTAILSSPEYQTQRAARLKVLTMDLCNGLKLFRREPDIHAFYTSCQENVTLPAMKLHEKLLMSTHHFYLDLNPYIVWNNRQDLETSPDFLENLGNLKCENMLQNRRPLNLAKVDPPPTRDDLFRDLVNVLTVAPGLYMRQIGRRDAIKEPIVVRKQHVLVAYGPQDKRDRLMSNGDRTLMNWIYFSARDKHERSAEGPWAAWKHITWG